MRGLVKWSAVLGLAVGLGWMRSADAQASYAATQDLALSAFGGLTGNYTNLEGGKNIGISAGVDLALPSFHRYRPVVEVRGTYPMTGGQIDAQREFLGGLRVERQYARWHPYVDFLVGRGQIDYQNGGFTYGNFTYLFSTSTVYSGGVGVDVDLTHHFAIRGDVQGQHWDTPFPVTPTTTTVASAKSNAVFAALGTAPQTIYPKMLTLGVVYRFDFNPHHHRR